MPRNDHKGRTTHDTTLDIDTFFASGVKGHEVRADGKGGSLKRGYYAMAEKGRNPGLYGPFSCRKKALRAAYGIS